MRKVRFTFTIPFDGGPADGCERSIRGQVTRSLLNSLSEIHPDIGCTIDVAVFEEGRPMEVFEQRWDGDDRAYHDVSLNSGRVRDGA